MTMPNDITAEDYLSLCKRQFGTANPALTNNAVWEWMVRTEQDPYAARQELGLEPNLGPPGDPDWCFQRLGSRRVRMPDGRLITIAGEHEDWYDPDFCIYNDVIVQREDTVEIYGYPKAVFPPTDFHTATLIGKAIYIIGCLGYAGERSESETPVFCLDTETYRIERIECSGDSPGWLFKHQAALRLGSNIIEIGGGEIVISNSGEDRFKDNPDTYHLDIEERIWHRITDNRRWRQYSFRYERDGRETIGDLSWYTGRILEGLGYRVELFDDDESDELYRTHVLYVGDVAVHCSDRYGEIRLVVKGELTESERDELLSKISSAAERTHRHVREIMRL